MLSLGACARVGGPAPVVAYGAQGSALRQVPPPVESQPGQIVVQRGDTLYAISRRTSAPLRALIDANNLHPPYALQSGQRLIVPHVRAYRVQPGDTLYAVARCYDVGLRELVEANALTPPYGLRSGEVLVLPMAGGAAPNAPAVPPTPVQTAALPPVASSPMAAPAPRPAVPMAAPTAPTAGVGAASPSRAYPPPVAAVTPSTPPSRPEPASRSTPNTTAAALPMPPAAMPAAPAQRPVPEPASLRTAEPPIPAPAPAPSPALAPSGSVPARAGRFLWPVNGTIVSDFGNKPGGLQNDGINIAAPRGTPIRAADDGVVVYAGNELRGFGNLLLVKHRGGWITAYAHAEELLVRRGSEVKRGQIIARVGNSGGVTTPQLHFEVRKGSKPLNPRDYLGPQTASAR